MGPTFWDSPLYTSPQENLKQLQVQYPERKTKGHYDSMAYFEAGNGGAAGPARAARIAEAPGGVPTGPGPPRLARQLAEMANSSLSNMEIMVSMLWVTLKVANILKYCTLIDI